VLTLAAVAAHKRMVIDRLAVVTTFDLALTPGVGTRTSFASRIEVDGRLDERERTILLNSARRCDVHKILAGQMSFDDELVVNPQ
jgi:uncharacterized OsmC-like protein